MRIQKRSHELVTIPCRKFVFRQRVEKALRNHDFPLQDIRLPPTPWLTSDEARDGLAPASNHDFLTGLDPRQQSRKLGLGFMYIDEEHRNSLPPKATI